MSLPKRERCRSPLSFRSARRLAFKPSKLLRVVADQREMVRLHGRRIDQRIVVVKCVTF